MADHSELFVGLAALVLWAMGYSRAWTRTVSIYLAARRRKAYRAMTDEELLNHAGIKVYHSTGYPQSVDARKRLYLVRKDHP